MNVEAGRRLDIEHAHTDSELFHRTWYPVALADAVVPNGVVGADYLNGRVVVWRKENGELSVFSAYCRHLGADLSLAEPLDGKLRCPFHHWSYDDDGQCADIPCANSVPGSASLFQYPVEEKHGLIWVFNGEAPDFPVAGFGDADDTEVVSEARYMGHIKCPAWVLKLNTLDVQHTRALHNQDIIEYPNISLNENGVMDFDYVVRDKKIGLFSVTGHYFGPNCIALAGTMESGALNFVVSAGTPVPQGGHDLFVSLGIPLTCNGVTMTREEGEEHLANLWTLYLRLFDEDLEIINSMRFRFDHLIGEDKYMKRVADYAKAFPIGNPGSAFIS
ncbi:MAG: Rieske 2Fe-2S domain-containing protein [Alphaproteobacteria bacterium]|nr:Rieske 2Fe-2S domain-containing protein [Alphaproteobacteria bacterium]